MSMASALCCGNARFLLYSITLRTHVLTTHVLPYARAGLASFEACLTLFVVDLPH
jgi:hypothetical protein